MSKQLTRLDEQLVQLQGTLQALQQQRQQHEMKLAQIIGSMKGNFLGLVKTQLKKLF